MLRLQFKFSTPLDAFLVIFGLTVAFGCGSSMPLLCITFGDTLQSFATNDNHKAIAEGAKSDGKDWEAPPSDVLEVLQWSVSTEMNLLHLVSSEGLASTCSFCRPFSGSSVGSL